MCVCPEGTAVPPGGSACEMIMMDGGTDHGPPDMGDLCRTVCEGATPVCDVEAQLCVGCVGDGDCPGGRCELSTQVCVECIETADCGGDAVCNPATNSCVECVATPDCTGEGGVCDPASNTCVECLSTLDCAVGLCLEAENRCVDCIANADCPSPNSSRCDSTTDSCGACTSHVDCGHIAGLPSCNAGTCVACTPATEATACGIYSCNRTTLTCTTTPRESLDYYRPCQADSECVEGAACVFQSIVGTDRHVCVPILTEASCLQHLPLTERQERLTVDSILVNVCAIRSDWLTLGAAQLLIEYERASTPQQGAIARACSVNTDCPANSVCRPARISGSTVASVCALAACASDLECPTGFDCYPGVAGLPEYCTVWNP